MIKATKGIRGAFKEINGKSWDFEPIFFQIFPWCFDSFYGPFYGWKYTFSLVLKYFVMHYQSSTDAKINPQSSILKLSLSVGAFCKADIYAKSKGEQLSTFSEKMCINDLTFGQFICTGKL